MTNEERAMLARINAYAEDVLGEIDPQKVQVSLQLEKLKPVMQEIANEQGVSITDIFIKYMDLQTEASCKSQQKLADSLSDINEGDGSMPLLIK